MDQQLADRLAIRDVIETWAIARDSGDWETFRGTWHDDGYMMATVDPAATLALDPGLLGSFPEGYRHLAYLQTQLGFTVKRDMPGLRGPEVERLCARGAAWLSGELAAPGTAAPADGPSADHVRPVMP